MSVVVAFYKGRQFGPWTSRALGWWQRSNYSHCEILLSRRDWYRFECASSALTDGGVRVKLRDLDPVEWDCWELPISAKFVRAWFDAHRGESYDLVGWLGFVFRRIKGLGKGWWCSEACVAALGWPDAWRFDVATLAAVCRAHGRAVALQEAFAEQLGGSD